jgi:hypothetical protein
MIRKILIYIAARLPKGRGKEYPQLWCYMPRNKRARKILQWLCGKLTGHELSKTEKGYGGGKFADQWCRWCDKMFKIPLQEMDWSPEVKDIIQYEFDQDIE